MNRLTSKVFTNALTYWTVPAGVTVVFVGGCGAGGNGKDNPISSGLFAAGGAPAYFSTIPVPVTPNATYAIAIGSGEGPSTFGSLISFAGGGENCMMQHLYDQGLLGTANAPSINDQRRLYALPGAVSNSEGGGACLGTGGVGGALNGNGGNAGNNTGSGGGGGGRSSLVSTLGGSGGTGLIVVWWNE